MGDILGGKSQDRLTTKQQVFVNAYLECWCAAEAARRANYKQPETVGPRLRRDPRIAAVIEERLAEHGMSAAECVARLAEQARGSLADFIDLPDGETAPSEGEATPTGHTRWSLNLQKARDRGKLHLLAELGWTEFGPKIKLHDPQAALVHIGRHLGLFTEKLDVGIRDERVAESLEQKLEDLSERLTAATSHGGVVGEPSPGDPEDVPGESDGPGEGRA